MFQNLIKVAIRNMAKEKLYSLIIILGLTIGIAVIIAFPLAYFLIEEWLSDFAYQTDIKVFTFVAAVLLTVVITSLSVGFQTLRAATANPVKSLRDN
ncbi:hypothetical protein WJR50_10815 [Catalinimonas sp. 4WD22]|uniref:hypothetical protein n=1 Tax=Catalinimonas locisalis TaxID=3133978 RepID=UPI0031012C4C